MLEPDEAARRIAAAIHLLAGEPIALALSDGLVLAADVVSSVSLPLWANSAMDGYACRQADLTTVPVTLAVVDQVRAGAFPSRDVGAGQATRIATGAPVPNGADSVVRIEDTDAGIERVEIRDLRDAGRNVRPSGEDVREGETVLSAGMMLGPGQIAMLAAVGVSMPVVHRRARVAIISTGDELVALDQFAEVRAGRRIVSSNSYGLMAAVRSAGAEPVDCGIVPDDPEALRAALAWAAECDLIITSAGVSVGEADYLKPVVSEMGGAVDFWRVRMRPGSPLAFGSVRGTPWIGLPGNPVSTMVTFELFARPAIRKLMGHRDLFASRIRVVLDEDSMLSVPVTHFLRVRLRQDGDGPPHATFTGPQPSNILSSVARADALLIVPADVQQVRTGMTFEAIPLGDALRHHIGGA